MSDMNTARRSIGEPSTSFDASDLCGLVLPRCKSEPMIDLQRAVFVRFRSFREPKRKNTAARHTSPPNPTDCFRVSTFSIPSSDDHRVAKRRCIRKRAKRRLEKQLSSSSSDCSPTPYNRLLMDNDISRFPSPPPTSETTLYPETDYREAKRDLSPSLLNHSGFLNGNHTPSLLAASSNGSFGDQIYDHDEAVIQEEIEKLREVARRINEKSKMERLRLQSTSSEGIEHLPPTWADSINYTEDMEQFIQNTVPMNPFSDPFEDHHSARRSRTEMWVESTSPGIIVSESEEESVEEEPSMIEQREEIEVPLVPQLTVDGCSESEGAPSTSSIPLPAFPIAIKVNGETLQGHKNLRGHMERDDSLQTDVSDASFVSSEIDKTSLAQLKFRTNLDKATEKQWVEIDSSQVDRFWKYLYEPESSDKPDEKPKVKEKNMRRCHTPTVDRVVLYYTSDRRPSMTPSLPPPSPSIYSASSPGLSGRLHLSADSASANNLFYRFPPTSPMTDKSARSTRSTIPERSESLESKDENELVVGSDDSHDSQDKPFGELAKEISQTAQVMIPTWKPSVYTVNHKGRPVFSQVIQKEPKSIEQPREMEEITIEVPTFISRSEPGNQTILESQELLPKQYVEVPERAWIAAGSPNQVVQKQYNEVPDAWKSTENLNDTVETTNSANKETNIPNSLDQKGKIVIYFSQDSELEEFKQHELLLQQEEPFSENRESANFDGRIYLVDQEQQFGSTEGDFPIFDDDDDNDPDIRISLTREERDKILREGSVLEDSENEDDGLSIPVNDLVAELFHLEECTCSSESEEENEPPETKEWASEVVDNPITRKTPTATVSPFLQRRLISRSTSTSDLLEVDEPSSSGAGSVNGDILEPVEPIEIRCENTLTNTATNSSDSVGSQDNFSPQSEHHSLLRDYRSPIPSFYSKSTPNPPGSSVLSNGRSHASDVNEGVMKLNPERPAHLQSNIQQHNTVGGAEVTVTPQEYGEAPKTESIVRISRRRSGSLRRRVIRLPSSTRSKSLSSLLEPKRLQHFEKGIVYMAVADCENPTLVIIDDDAADTEVSLGGLLADKTIEDLEMSSTEDLLNLDANRPCSSGRKSVTFSDFIDVEIISPQNIRRVSADSHNYLLVKPILKKDDKTRETMRKMIDYARDRLYKDLRMLVEERDRSIHAIQLTSNSSSNLTAQTGFYQTRYREKLQDNKATLDSKIEQVWQKLKELPLEESQSLFVYSVHNSEALTLNSRRRVLPRRYTSYYVLERKQNKYDNLELASDYAVKLQKLRGNLIRRESEIRREDERSVEDIVSRVSRALMSCDKKY